MIPRIGEFDATRIRFGATVLDSRGIPSVSSPASSTVRVVTDQVPRSVIERLPEGQRVRDTLFFISYDDIRAGDEQGDDATDGTPADHLTVDGLTYQVQEVWRVQAWMGDPEHIEGYGVRVQPRTAAT